MKLNVKQKINGTPHDYYISVPDSIVEFIKRYGTDDVVDTLIKAYTARIKATVRDFITSTSTDSIDTISEFACNWTPLLEATMHEAKCKTVKDFKRVITYLTSEERQTIKDRVDEEIKLRKLLKIAEGLGDTDE